ncbi:unnamed protein product [Rangifer tarandus platyrhynchus]|uniref:Uncharacterized protein n=2 Tax=Rangifer tarandus platyrhynchus TaxID=3082113 RepID=A0ABN8Y215_RANTA|nr:unnamed protein product [Rangifer tarandus platyrhynchus]CAI9713518.1 unnamed protein product [Rangifer tarandus platyrhynchus]
MLEPGPRQAPPPDPPQPSQSALPQRPDVPGVLAVPQAGRRCLLFLGFAPGCGGPTPPQPSSRVTGEVKDRLLRSSTRILRMLEEAAARSSCQAYSQVSCHGLSILARVGQTRVMRLRPSDPEAWPSTTGQERILPPPEYRSARFPLRLTVARAPLWPPGSVW